MVAAKIAVSLSVVSALLILSAAARLAVPFSQLGHADRKRADAALREEVVPADGFRVYDISAGGTVVHSGSKIVSVRLGQQGGGDDASSHKGIVISYGNDMISSVPAGRDARAEDEIESSWAQWFSNLGKDLQF
ncbi:uncharacterized protein LOC141819023 [Curcuma longa]|uniref:uncharacterized protein LOC141819023 n=1 Tax=Curcuma longa TaxID=136217 RepID=UPI003D9EAB1C